MAISNTRSLPEKQAEIVLAVNAFNRCCVSLILVYSLQLAQHQPSERVEPGNTAYKPHGNKIDGMSLAHVFALVSQNRLQILLAHRFRTNNHTVEEREGQGIVIQQCQLEIALPLIVHFVQAYNNTPHREQQKNQRHSQTKQINY